MDKGSKALTNDEKSPLNMSNEEIHQTLHEISRLEQRVLEQRERLLEEAGLRGLMETEVDSQEGILVEDPEKGSSERSGTD